MGAELGQLLEAEQAFAERVAAARRDARALVQAARDEAGRLASDSSAQLEKGRKELADREERALTTELARLEAESSARVERLSSVSDARVATLADQLLRALVAGDGS
jgi:vacuolar-type H+-ATPase subunit H